MDDFLKENQNLRCPWNTFPQTKLDKERLVVPLGFHYTPLKAIDNLQLLEYYPVLCGNCQSVLNPFCCLDFKSKAWECMFCYKKNLLPGYYSQHINETTLPLEVLNENTTVEYKLDKKGVANHPVFFYIIDTAVNSEELIFLKDQLINIIENLPDEAMVGIIIFGTMVNLLEIGFTDFTKMHVFRGDKEYSAQDIQEMLLVSLGSRVNNGNQINQANNKLMNKKFLQPKSECFFTLTTFLDELSGDNFPSIEGNRKKNCGGLALHVAVLLLEALCNGDPCRILLFLGGPPTIGLGKIVNCSLTWAIRDFVDFQKNNDNTKYFKTAVQFYENIATRAYKAGQIIDIASCCFNQVGLTEMISCVERTGGVMILSDSFGTLQFKDSFSKIFKLDENGDYKMNFHGKIDFFVTNPFTVNGVVGYATSVDIKNQKTLEMVGKEVIG